MFTQKPIVEPPAATDPATSEARRDDRNRATGLAEFRDVKSGRILIVEDEIPLRRFLQRTLDSVGFTSTAVGTLNEALGEVSRHSYDLVLLDVLLPDGDGFACCRRIRTRYHMPIIIMSTKSAIADRVTGLGSGADDYIVKPFDPAELIARVKAHLRRVRELDDEGQEATLRLGGIVVDPLLQDALVDDQPARLTQKEFRLLQILGSRAGRAVSTEYLLNELWSGEESASENKLAVYVRRLRKKIEKDPDHPQILLTVRRFGYRLATPDV